MYMCIHICVCSKCVCVCHVCEIACLCVNMYIYIYVCLYHMYIVCVLHVSHMYEHIYVFHIACVEDMVNPDLTVTISPYGYGYGSKPGIPCSSGSSGCKSFWNFWKIQPCLLGNPTERSNTCGSNFACIDIKVCICTYVDVGYVQKIICTSCTCVFVWFLHADTHLI